MVKACGVKGMSDDDADGRACYRGKFKEKPPERKDTTGKEMPVCKQKNEKQKTDKVILNKINRYI